MKHQLGLMFVLIGSTFTPSSTQAALDKKVKFLPSGSLTLRSKPNQISPLLTNVRLPVFRGTHWLSLPPTQPIGHPLLRRFPGS